MTSLAPALEQTEWKNPPTKTQSSKSPLRSRVSERVSDTRFSASSFFTYQFLQGP
jgi:hypothetical protein